MTGPETSRVLALLISSLPLSHRQSSVTSLNIYTNKKEAVLPLEHLSSNSNVEKSKGFLVFKCSLVEFKCLLGKSCLFSSDCFPLSPGELWEGGNNMSSRLNFQRNPVERNGHETLKMPTNPLPQCYSYPHSVLHLDIPRASQI